MSDVIQTIINLLFPSGPITQGYGPSDLSGEPPYNGYAHFHQGIDISVPTGTPIKAPADGKIIQAGLNGGYGNSVIVDVGNGYTVLQGHAQNITARVGQMVKKGDIIGYSDNTGYSTGPHIHFEVRQNGHPVDPKSVSLTQQSGNASVTNYPNDANASGTLPGGVSDYHQICIPAPTGQICFPNPVAPFIDVIDQIKTTLANPETWLRVGLVVGGMILVSMGMYAIANVASEKTTGSSIPQNAAKVAAVAA